MKNGDRIFRTSKHTLERTLLDKCLLKCGSNTVVQYSNNAVVLNKIKARIV